MEEVGLFLEEGVAGLAEALEDGCIHLLRCEADGLPLCLQFLYLLCDGFPVGEGAEAVGLDGFDLFAEFGLALQVFFFACLDGLEVCLVLLVDDGGCFLELGPYGLADFLGYGSCLLPFLVEGLQLVEGGEHVGVLSQCLGLLDETRLDLEVLAEVVVAQFVSELEEVVVLLYVELVVLPEFGGAFGGYGFYLFPFGLQSLELVEVLVGFLGCGCELLYAFYYLELALEVLLLLLFDVFLDGGPALAYDLHGFAEGWLGRVYLGYELVRFAACVDVGLEGCLHFGVVELVEELLEEGEFLFVAHFVALCYFLHAGHDLVLRAEGLLHDGLFVLGCLCVRHVSCFGGHGFFGSGGLPGGCGCLGGCGLLGYGFVVYCGCCLGSLLCGSVLRRLLYGSGFFSL